MNQTTLPSFSDFFRSLWPSRDPFPWQRMLAERLAEGRWPKALDLPTASGKTACIDVAAYALASQSDKPVRERTAPRRIWFVVDRRIVVDEAFDRAKKLAEKLNDAREGPLKEIADRLRNVSGTERPLAVARLRGGTLHDDGWARLPCQPAVITSTVDQLGSRLLFRGYGRSALAAPIFAGLAAHDSLILLDEAHLSIPFMQTLRAIQRYRGEKWAAEPIRTPFAFTMLSATLPADISKADIFPGTERDAALDHPLLTQRIGASKPAELMSIASARSAEDRPFVDAAVLRAETWVKRDGKRRVAVVVNRVHVAESIAEALRDRNGDELEVVLLTGRMRPFERDRLVETWGPVLKAGSSEQPARPLVLVSTQCIEVGADFSFDALVTEAASLDALRQRFGRLDRLGDHQSSPAAILVRDEDIKDDSDDPIYGPALAQCWRLLQDRAVTRKEGPTERKLVDFGVAALDLLLQEVEAEDLQRCIAPQHPAPLLLPSHIDLLCQTAPRPRVEPDVALYLHGTGRGPPEVRVAWRADLNEDSPKIWAETISMCPPNSLETLTVPLYRLRHWLSRAQDGDESGDVDESGDIEGARESETSPVDGIKPVLVWQGRERSRLCDRASELRPNDVVILPATYGIKGLGQSTQEPGTGEHQLDIWEPSHARTGKPIALRLHRAVLRPWLDRPPLQALLELAEADTWDQDEVRNAIDAVRDYKSAGSDEPAPLPAWLLALLRKVRDGRFERHPDIGLVLKANKTEVQEEGEQDNFADDDDLLSIVGEEVSLPLHSASVEWAVHKIADRCLPVKYDAPLTIAAYWHDVGKVDDRFQLWLRQGNELAMIAGSPLAKSADMRRDIRKWCGLPDQFRHEMLSLQLAERFLVRDDPGAQTDLVLHAIASHHGHGRPFAPFSLDPTPPPVKIVHDGVTIEADQEARASWPPPHSSDSGIGERFWRLNRRYGWWGLAYLEAILRLGDWYGSRRALKQVSERPARTTLPPQRRAANGESLTLAGFDGANPLGFLAAIGALVVLHQAGDPNVRLSWCREGLAWRPRLVGLHTLDPAAISERLAHRLRGTATSDGPDQRRKEAERRLTQKKRQITELRTQIDNRGLRAKERSQALQDEVEPLEHEAIVLQSQWRDALRGSVASPELALGKNVDCTDSDYRSVVEPLLEEARFDARDSVDLLSAFCSTGCLHESRLKRKEGKLAATPFALISGSGHQDFLETACALLQRVSPERLTSTMLMPWTYEDEGLSMRWDPIEDRRYALMDRDPTASDNKPRTVWMANLLAYRALALFPSAPNRKGLLTTGWHREEGGGEQVFIWPLWTSPLGPDSIRSLLLLEELSSAAEKRAWLRARGISAVFRSRRLRVGAGANFKLNFSPSRQI